MEQLDKLTKILEVLDMNSDKASSAEIAEVLVAFADAIRTRINQMEEDMANADTENSDDIHQANIRLDKVDAKVDAGHKELLEAIEKIELTPGEPGKDADPNEIIRQVLELMPKDETPKETPEQIVEKVNTSTTLVKKSQIEGLADIERMAVANANATALPVTTTHFYKDGTPVGRAKNINFSEGANVTLTMTQTGDTMNVVVSATGGSGSTIYTETLTDSGDHQNFTAAHDITTIYVLATLNGQYISSENYTKSGNTITLTSADSGIASVGLEIVYS